MGKGEGMKMIMTCWILKNRKSTVGKGGWVHEPPLDMTKSSMYLREHAMPRSDIDVDRTRKESKTVASIPFIRDISILTPFFHILNVV